MSATTVLRRGGAKFASYLELKNTCIIINVKQAKTKTNNSNNNKAKQKQKRTTRTGR